MNKQPRRFVSFHCIGTALLALGAFGCGTNLITEIPPADNSAILGPTDGGAAEAAVAGAASDAPAGDAPANAIVSAGNVPASTPPPANTNDAGGTPPVTTNSNPTQPGGNVIHDPPAGTDLNGDGVLSNDDIEILRGLVGPAGPGPLNGDFNGDGIVDLSDVAYLLGLFK